VLFVLVADPCGHAVDAHLHSLHCGARAGQGGSEGGCSDLAATGGKVCHLISLWHVTLLQVYIRHIVHHSSSMWTIRLQPTAMADGKCTSDISLKLRQCPLAVETTVCTLPVTVFLAWCRLLDWSDYLLPVEVRRAAAARAHPPAAHQQQDAAAQGPAPDTTQLAADPSAPHSTAAGSAGADAGDVQVAAGTAAEEQQQQAGLSLQTSSCADAASDQPPAVQAEASGAAAPAEQEQPLLQQASSSTTQLEPTQRQQQQHIVLPHPVQWYEQQEGYSWKVLGLGVALLGTMVLLNTLLLTLPIGVGRALFTALHLPFKNDLFTGIIGLIVLSGGYTFAVAVASSASLMNLRAVAAAAWRWSVLVGQCAVLLFLWLGVVATMLGMLCELVLLPLRLPPNQTALIYLYQDWTMGVLALVSSCLSTVRPGVNATCEHNAPWRMVVYPPAAHRQRCSVATP